MWVFHKAFNLTALCLSMFSLFGQYDLAYKLEIGEKFRIKQSAIQKMVMSIEGAEQIIDNELEGLFLMEVSAFENNVYTITLSFEDFAMKSTSNSQGVMIDVRASQSSEGDMMATILSGLLEQGLSMEMRSDGKLLSVTGTDELMDNMLAKAGELDDFSKKMMRKALEKEFSSESLSSSFEQMTYIYPEKPVQLGGTWKTEFNGKVVATNKWTLEKVENGVVSISGTANITANNVQATITMALEGTQETLVQANEKNGFIRKLIVRSSSKGVSTTTMAPEVEIPTTLNHEVVYEIITE